MGLLTGDKKTDALLVAGGIAALAGIAYYAYQNKLLGNFFSPGTTTTSPEDDDTSVVSTSTTPPTATTTPIIPGGAPYYPIVPPQPPLPWQYNYIFNPTIIDDGVNSVPQTTTAFDEIVQAAIDRGTTDQDTQVIVETPSTSLSKTCKKCYDKCKNAKKSKLKECQKCGVPCGFTVKLTKNKVKVTKQSNLVLALQGQYYTPRSRVYDQGFVVRDFG